MNILKVVLFVQYFIFSSLKLCAVQRLLEHKLLDLQNKQEPIIANIDFHHQRRQRIPLNTKEEIEQFKAECVNLAKEASRANSSDIARKAKAIKNTIFLQRQRLYKKRK
ncbi:hypothetical protein HYX58_00845 [Candidatus Dependentiae bacterium]|nr:hypothetical protein [Candidatus Dependentiae bacterium]